MQAQLTIETDLFDTREVKPHFINDCCFGEDFAQWLRLRVGAMEGEGFELGDPIQEDYGWGFWVSHGKDTFWIALGYVGEGPTEGPSEWVVSIDYDSGLNLIKRLFHKPDVARFETVRDRIFGVLKATERIRVTEEA